MVGKRPADCFRLPRSRRNFHCTSAAAFLRTARPLPVFRNIYPGKTALSQWPRRVTAALDIHWRQEHRSGRRMDWRIDFRWD